MAGGLFQARSLGKRRTVARGIAARYCTGGKITPGYTYRRESVILTSKRQMWYTGSGQISKSMEYANRRQERDATAGRVRFASRGTDRSPDIAKNRGSVAGPLGKRSAVVPIPRANPSKEEAGRANCTRSTAETFRESRSHRDSAMIWNRMV